MATIKGKFISGTVGPVIYRTYRGKQIMVSKATKNYNIAEGTMKNASTFGKASTLACQIRRSLENIVTSNYDGTMPGRLLQEMAHIVKNAADPDTGAFSFDPFSFDPLNGFQFNSKSPFNHSLLVTPYINIRDNQLTLHLPELKVPKELKFPFGASSCNINMMMVELNLLGGNKKKTLIGTTTIENNKATHAAQKWTTALQEGCLAVIAMSLNFVKQGFAGAVVLNNKSFCPATIIQAGFMTAIDQTGPLMLDTKKFKWAPIT